MWLKRHFGRRKVSVKQLGELETELMERAWAQQKEVSVRDLHTEMDGRLAYTTLMTTLDRLYKKGLLRRRMEGHAYLYSAALTEQQYQARLTENFLGIVLHDRKNCSAVLSCFVETLSGTDLEMLEQLNEIVRAKRRQLSRRP
jgi:predicted transcriptional regulator